MKTETKVEHTPTPWYREDIVSEGGPTLRKIEIGTVHHTVAVLSFLRDHDAEEVKANAEFIVRAVNAHDELVAALKLAERLLSANVPEYLRPTWNANADRHRELIRAALAKAEGK
jgi:hypothetical protein